MVCPVSGSVGLRFYLQLNHRHREVDGFQNNRVLIVADGVAGGNGFQAHRRTNIARQNFLDIFTLIGVHAQQTPDALLAPLGHVVYRIARL